MTLRSRLGLAVAGAYFGALAYATVATQCPVHEAGGGASDAAAGRITCAMVHALMHAARPPAPAAITAVPMRAPAPHERAEAPIRMATAAR